MHDGWGSGPSPARPWSDVLMTMTAWSHRVTCHAAGVTALQSDHAVEILPDSWCRLHMQRYCALTRGAHQLLTVKRSPAQHHFQLHATLLRDYNYMKRTLRQRSTIARANNSTAEASQDTTQSAARRRKKQPKTETIEHSNTTEPRDGLTRYAAAWWKPVPLALHAAAA